MISTISLFIALLLCASAKAETCSGDEFVCVSDGDCQPMEYICDGYDDCADSSDEVDCSKCADGAIFCPGEIDTNKCIQETWLCDGFQDCGDLEDPDDERNCTDCADTASHCPGTDDKCIDNTWFCDQQEDCPDGTDEQDCNPPGYVVLNVNGLEVLSINGVAAEYDSDLEDRSTHFFREIANMIDRALKDWFLSQYEIVVKARHFDFSGGSIIADFELLISEEDMAKYLEAKGLDSIDDQDFLDTFKKTLEDAFGAANIGVDVSGVTVTVDASATAAPAVTTAAPATTKAKYGGRGRRVSYRNGYGSRRNRRGYNRRSYGYGNNRYSRRRRGGNNYSNNRRRHGR